MKKKRKSYFHFYSYRIVWSDEDQSYLGRCLELPSLLAHGPTEEAALKEIKIVVDATIKWMKAEGEKLPQPITKKKFSPNFLVRGMPLDVRREFELEAQEENTSVNSIILKKLKQAIS